MAPLRMTLTAQLVLRALLADPGREVYGREVMQGAGLASGTVYPILARLEAEGWVKSRDEEIDKRAEGRPRRRYYKLTAKGTEEATAAMARAATQLSRLGLNGAQEPSTVNVGGIEIRVITDDRQPPGTVSLVSAGTGRDGELTADVVRMVNVAEEEPENCKHPAARVHKGLCGRCGTHVG